MSPSIISICSTRTPAPAGLDLLWFSGEYFAVYPASLSN
jgi:hypothetical protein